jgi:predicted molibdopterin-dependent oxidoreductase YjgC
MHKTLTVKETHKNWLLKVTVANARHSPSNAQHEVARFPKRGMSLVAMAASYNALVKHGFFDETVAETSAEGIEVLRGVGFNL